MTFLGTAWQSLLEAFFMFWGTLWALILGFTLSGAVQSFVSRREMQAAMGDHRPTTVVRTGLLGMASSSCSYAASALAKSLFQRGADFTAAMVFMIASTNLVVELGIVLWLLIGWQFALAEFIGGTIMIALFALIGPRLFRAAELEQARERLIARADRREHSGDSDAAERRGESLWRRLRSRAGWADAAGYAVSDVSMLRRELLIGYLVAGNPCDRGSSLGVSGDLLHRARDLDRPAKRHRGPLHRVHQLRVLDRQCAVGRGSVQGRAEFRRNDRVRVR